MSNASTDVGSAATRAARTGVGVVFVLNGLVAATLVSRVPDLRGDLGLDNTGLGLLLLSAAVGSVGALPTSGLLVARRGARSVVRLGSVLSLVGLTVVALGAGAFASVVATAPGLVVFGVGIGLWDVAMNVEAAEVERRLSRTVMPRFHAGFSVGTILGGLLGVLVTAVGVPLVAHVPLVVAAALVVAWPATGSFLEVVDGVDGAQGVGSGPVRSAWREPRILAVGAMVLAFAVAEGSANDWLSLALIDGYDAPHWVGVGGFALFVTAMTVGRLVGTSLIDRFGRVVTLLGCAALVVVGLLVMVHGQQPVLVAVGVVGWGLGASLGFPVGISAAADDPARSPARVSVVSTIGYAAFLAGPPLLGRLGDAVGTLDSLQAVAALMVLAVVFVPAARPTGRPAATS